MDEIKKATFQLGSDIAPGPDSLNLRFYQRFWEVVKEDLFNTFQDCIDGTLNSRIMDYSYICLIPKKESAKQANDFRPISLINGVQKIISKILANRLEDVMKDILSPTQVAFLKDQSILDSVAIASEIVSWCSKTSEECVGIKANFEKVYDRVRWDFLRKIMMFGANHK